MATAAVAFGLGVITGWWLNRYARKVDHPRTHTWKTSFIHTALRSADYATLGASLGLSVSLD
eukprot:jgi/Botrbrau1/3327/Bobra.0048s0022.1